MKMDYIQPNLKYYKDSAEKKIIKPENTLLFRV